MKSLWIKIILISLVSLSLQNNKNKGSRFDRFYKDCSSSKCAGRSNDDTCVYRCMSEKCFTEIYGNYLLEYGEVNFELKNSFEQCFNKETRNA
jgi:hypothetical protein